MLSHLWPSVPPPEWDTLRWSLEGKISNILLTKTGLFLSKITKIPQGKKSRLLLCTRVGKTAHFACLDLRFNTHLCTALPLLSALLNRISMSPERSHLSLFFIFSFLLLLLTEFKFHLLWQEGFLYVFSFKSFNPPCNTTPKKSEIKLQCVLGEKTYFIYHPVLLHHALT